MNRDETKRAADHCAQDNTPKACQECEVRLKPDCATYFARAYLALREQVETVMHELEECRSGECYCLERAQAAIKAIEEAQS